MPQVIFVRRELVPGASSDAYIGRSIVTDALEYEADRETIHAVMLFPAQTRPWEIRVSLHHDVEGQLAETVLGPASAGTMPKAELVIAANTIPSGSLVIRAALFDDSGAELDSLERRFARRAGTTATGGPGPVEIPLRVEGYPGTGNASWPISTAVPLSRGLVRDPGQLALLEDEDPVSAQFATQALWSKNGSISWVAVDFVASYRDGQPRSYKIRVTRTPERGSPGHPVATEHPNTIDIRVKGERFVIDKRGFAGPLPDGCRGASLCGPYIVDEAQKRYEARNVPPDSIEVVENGPVKATVMIKGRYGSADGQPVVLCRYVTQVIAFADSPILRVSHRTILTTDPHVTRLADVGWAIPTSFSGAAHFGVDREHRLVEPQSGGGAFVHQDRHDRCWLLTTSGTQVQRQDLPMKRADGYVAVEASSQGGSRGVAVLLRDMYQKFPKELGVTWTGEGAELSIHFWPHHGSQAFDAASEVHRNDIHKLWYAHQGSLLDLKMPQAYVDALGTIRANPIAEETELEPSEIQSAQGGKAIGVAIGNDFGIFYGRIPSDDGLLSLAQTFQCDPHAVADPTWSESTGVEGRWAARDIAAAPRIESAIENGIGALASAITDVGGEYGMWIYADVHDRWLPHAGTPWEWGIPQLHRVWQASHYRNVWTNWFLYLRSGLPALRLWARATSDHYLNIHTIHHVDALIRADKYLGEMYHCNATTPWGADSGLYGHYIDPDAHRLRGLLQRDLYAFDAYQLWFSELIAIDPAVFAQAMIVERDAINTFGAIVSYYLHYQDPNALLLLQRLATMIFDRYWDPALQRYRFVGHESPADHPIWHRQCFSLYHALTNDPRALEYITDWLAEGYTGRTWSANSFAYLGTGQPDYLTSVLPQVWDQALMHHRAPGDRYHGYGPAAAFGDGIYFQQEAPYFLRAMKDAGLIEADGEDPPAIATPPICYPSVRWAQLTSGSLAVRAYVLVPANASEFAIKLVPRRHKNTVEAGRCEVFRCAGGQCGPAAEVIVGYGQDPSTLDIAVAVPASSAETLYRIDVFSAESEFEAPFTVHPEVIEVRTVNADDFTYSVHSWGRQSFWLDWRSDPQFPSAQVELAGQSSWYYYHQPAFVRMRSIADQVLTEGTVFAWAQTPDRVTLPEFRKLKSVLGDGRPWHFRSAGLGGPVLRLRAGPPRIFLAREREHLAKVIPSIP